MKKVFRVLGCGALLAAFCAAPALAQQDDCTPLYEKYLASYKGNLDQRKAAVDAGEQYIAKCNVEANKEQIEYLKKRVPDLRKRNESEETISAFDNAVKDPATVNADVAFSSGRKILANDPNLVDVMLVLATIGFDKAAAPTPIDTYNADAVNYARQAIQKIEGGATSKQYGAWKYTYTTKEYPDGKNNALAWMNYTVGYIMYNRQNQKKEALPYFYKAVQYNSAVKKNPVVYQAIGDYYKNEYNRIDDERTKIAEQAKNEANEETKKQLIDKAKELLGLQKGYADRMIDAYARAWANAGTDKTYRDALYNTLRILYTFRHDNKTEGFSEAYLNAFAARPLPDPASTVTPVVETTTTAATTTSSSVPAASATTNSAAAATANKPAVNGVTTTATTKPTAANGAATGTTAKPAAPAKKPAAPKKKGTR